jgi:hypothetical protein
MYFPVTPSTDFAAGSLVALSSGKLVPATNTVDSFYIVGVIRHTIASTDANYALDRMVEVEVPVELNTVWEADVKVGTLVATSVGLYFDLTTADDGSGVDQSASSLDIVLCTKYISASKGWFILNIGALAHVKA